MQTADFYPKPDAGAHRRASSAFGNSFHPKSSLLKKHAETT
jgi:hypothetical protein